MRERIATALAEYCCHHTSIDDGDGLDGLPLVDKLTPPDQTSIDLGLKELDALADAIYDALPDDLADARRWRTLCANFGNERDEATPGKPHAIRITLNPDGCEVLNPDGSLSFAATLAAIMDDEARIQGAAGVAPVEGKSFTTDQERCFMECLQVAYDSGHADHRTGAPHRRDYAKTTGAHHLKLMRAAGVGAIDHHTVAPTVALPAQPEQSDRETTAEYTLRAMCKNYKVGHMWDELDADACLKAADAIHSLRQRLKETKV